MATKDEIQKVLRMLKAAYPNYRPEDPEAMIDVYARKLAQFSAGALEKAVDQYIDHGKFFPTVSELIALARTNSNALTDDQETELDKLARQIKQGHELRQEANTLEDLFTYSGELDPDVWEATAKEFESAGHGFGAQRLRERFKVRMSEMQVA